MLKVFTYYNDDVRPYFLKSMKSLASVMLGENIELFIFSKTNLPGKDIKLLSKIFYSIDMLQMTPHTLDEPKDKSIELNYAFTETLVNHTSFNRLYVDPRLFFVTKFNIPTESNLFFHQHKGTLSMKLCYFQAGFQFKNALSTMKRSCLSCINPLEFNFLIYNNYLIKKDLHKNNIVSGDMFNNSSIQEFSLAKVVAIDMTNTNLSSSEKSTTLINSIECNHKPIVLSNILRKAPKRLQSDNVKALTTTTTTEDPIKRPFSILITAYKTANYIEECLDSIENQTYFKDNDDYEILIGVDGCHETLAKLKEISHKYRNLSVYMMTTNSGTYITTNTLISLAKNENIIRFDSDDIMREMLVQQVANHIKYDIVRLSYNNFKNLNQIEDRLYEAHGIIHFKKKMMDEVVGGYMPWKCGADTELINRVKSLVTITRIPTSVFYRRLHSESLTLNPATGFESELRKNYKKQIKPSYRSSEIFVKRVIGPYKKI